VPNQKPHYSPLVCYSTPHHSRPYKGVIAEKQIRRLKSQVQGERKKMLTGKPRSSLDLSCGGRGERFEAEDQQDDAADRPPHERRLCKMVQRSKSSTAASVSLVSTEKLLEASLCSLESMGRHMSVAGTQSIAMGADGSAWDPNSSAASHAQAYPNDSYLRGAMWLGRNFTIVAEELAQEMDDFRTNFMGEVAVASQDTDMRRCCHRLTLLANSGITQAHTMAHKSRLKTREILEVTT
jgi:hypothetical protein